MGTQRYWSATAVKHWTKVLHLILKDGLDPLRCSEERRRRLLGDNWSHADFMHWLEEGEFVITPAMEIVGTADGYTGLFRGTFTGCTRVLQRSILRQISVADAAKIEMEAA